MPRTELKPATQEFVKKIVHQYPETWNHGCCAFTAVDATKDQDFHLWRYDGSRGRTGDVCHAPLNYLTKENKVIFVNAHKKRWADTSKDFVLWATKEGPFTHGVLNRDNDDELLGHADVLDVPYIGNAGALWICKALRHFEEDTWKIKTWEELRSHGLTGLQAFIGADILDQEGEPSPNTTHVSLFCYNKPKILRKQHDNILKEEERWGSAAATPNWGYHENWGALTSKKVKVSDGWGGFYEVTRPCDSKDYAEKLKEIFEGDPNNVK